ncbi:MAG: metalloenzyme [Armatimonadota bacterium]|nr:metalloenzyme [Armatimonadota bacterium]MDR7611221.1 metalloenzyme [Armatimonadota bacterium]
MNRRALLLFVDGLGLGADDPQTNPVAAARTPCLRALLGRPLAGITGPLERDGVLLVPTDATLGVEGLPQSATGQTALLTGVNAARLAGRHITAYPTAALRGLLETSSLFARVRAGGREAALANAYTPEYFAAVAGGRLRHAAITYAALAAGVTLRGVEDLRAGRAVFHDLTNARPRAWGYDVPAVTPRRCGRHLAALAMSHHLTVFEFFLTDLAAHGRVALDRRRAVEMLDELLAGVLDAADLASTLVALTSDHGNIEDATTPTHTRNPVPTLLVGAGRSEVGARISSLTDVAPALLAWLEGPAGG